MTMVRPRGRVRELTGFKVLLMLLAFFGTIAAMNAVMVHYAVSTFGGVETENAYTAGLHYQAAIEDAARQRQLGWNVTTEVKPLADGGTELKLRPVDASGRALAGIEVAATLRHLADRRLDESLVFVETAPGLYVASAMADRGLRELAIELRRDGEIQFRSLNRLVLH